MDEIELNQWDEAEPSLYTHTYTDRKLYLPGEQVHLKSVVRNSNNLSIPVGKELRYVVKDPKGKDAGEFTLTLNEYGSMTRTITLKQDAVLGSYQVFLYDGEENVGQTGFSVEVFKNPKFKNEVMLQTTGLNEELLENVTETEETTDWGYETKKYRSNFEISAAIKSEYYSGSPVKNAEFSYKVYAQDYYDNEYWDDCYYGCYWEPEKELYTEGNGRLDTNGKAKIKIPVEFSSYYSDYKYIVEVTVTDAAGDTISGANALIARLPNKYKRWNPDVGIFFETDKRFYKAGETFQISGGLTQGDFSKAYEDDYVLIIKKKEYSTHYVKDVRGQERPITRSKEVVEKVLPVNSKNFQLKNGKLSLNYTLKESGEYVFEFGKIDTRFFNVPNDIENKKEVFDDVISQLQADPTKKVDL